MTGRCEDCAYYAWDEDGDGYVCTQSPDMDEMERFLGGHTEDCPYYRNNDDYALVRHQN